MDQPVLIVNAPELDDASAEKIVEFLYNFLGVFENHYYPQLLRHARQQEKEKLMAFLDRL